LGGNESNILGFLDGRPGKREDKSRRIIHSNNARRAGNILLLRELRRATANKDALANNELAEIMRMFEDTEGFANAIVGYPASDLLERCRDNEPRIRSALEIVKYLVRSQSLPEEKRNIEEAKYFVAKWPEFEDCLVSSAEPERGKKTAPGVKSLEKIWAEFSAASPYLLALYLDETFEATIFNDLDQTIDWVKQFAANAERVSRFLGIAASVTDVLSEMSVRKHRGKDFKDVARVPLKLPPYSAEQIEMISTQDRHAEEKKKDGEDWHPRMKN
jgi:hypothetical protein